MLLEVNHELCYLLIAWTFCLLCYSPVQSKQVDEYLRRVWLCVVLCVGFFLLPLHPFNPVAEALLHFQGCMFCLAELCLEKSLTV